VNGIRQRFVPALLWLLLVTAPTWNIRAQTNSDDAFIKAVSAGFLTWDKDHDQTLSLDELDAAIENPANKGQAAAALAALKRAARSTNYTLPALTLANICQLARNPPATNQPDLHGMYNSCLKRITGVTNHELFASSLPQLSTVRQGRMGDCFCLAPLGAMIHRDPREVASLFSVQADGRVRVEFGGGAVSVAPPTDAELAMTAGNSHDGVWVNLYEKAIGEVRNDQRAPDKRSDLAIDAIANGGSEGRIMSYLTGRRVTGSGFKFAKDAATTPAARATQLDELRQKLVAATSQKRLMACGTQKPTTPGLTPKHAYAVLDYDAQTDSVELWNPHGNNFKPKGPPGLSNGYPTKNGFFTVPVAELVQQFSGMSFESKFTDISLESAEPATDTPRLQVGDPAPEWKSGKWIQGEPVTKFSPGKAYLVEFWATWCEPCRISIHYLNEIHNRYKDKGLIVIGQDYWEHDQKQVAPFIKAMGDEMTYRVTLEDKPVLGKSKMAQHWLAAAGRDSLPTAFLVDPQGRVAWIGHPLALKEQLIEDVLAGTFDSQKVAAEYAHQRAVRRLFKQATALAQDGKLADAEAPLNQLLLETNDDTDQTVQFLALRGNVLARTARWQQAADDLARATQIDPSSYWNWNILTPLLIQSGKIADYQAHCKAMLDRFGNTTIPRIAEGTAKTCLLLPSALGPDDLAAAANVAEKAVALSAKGDRMHWRLMTKGLAEYRQGHFTNAIEEMQHSQEVLAHEPEAARDMCEADTYFVMSMSRYQLKQPAESRAALARGLDIVRKKLPKLDGADLGQTWYDVLPSYILMREAKETIEGVSAKEDRPGEREKL
jgi:thiol-disulfide isomerase/thioredoxin